MIPVFFLCMLAGANLVACFMTFNRILEAKHRLNTLQASIDIVNMKLKHLENNMSAIRQASTSASTD